MKYYFFLLSFTLLFSCNGGGGGSSKPNLVDGNNTSSSSDPLAQYAWHLENIGQTTFSSSSGEVGYDLRMKETFSAGIHGEGIRILVSDTGVEGTHEDLKDNFSTTNYDYRLSSPYISNQALPSDNPYKFGEPHGTMVAGIIAASFNNNIGSRGVAPKAVISSANYMASDVSREADITINQVLHNFDIVNESWGWPQCDLSLEDTSYNDQVEYAGKYYRNNKGMVIVKSAGNDYNLNLLGSCGRSDVNRVGNSNYDSRNNTPEITVVGAFNALGYASSYSSPGANIWISAPGGEYGVDYQEDGPAIITTDRVGCDYGHSGLSFYYFHDYRGYYYFQNAFDGIADGDYNALNPHCDYTASMNGTSSAAPMVSGAVALLLEVNSNLTLRDVKHILASTAYELKDKPEYQINPNVSSPIGHQWEQGWITNRAGYKFHNRFGFGAVHVDNAVAMAKNNYQLLPEQFRTRDLDENWIYSSGSLSLPVPDNSAAGLSHQIYVSHNFNIEAVQLRVTATHSNLGDLGIELVSPEGTKSIISNVNNSLDGSQNLNSNLFLSNAFYGESSAGLWTVKLIDGKSGSTGTLKNWKINIIGNLKDVNPGPVVNLSNESTYSSLNQSPNVSWDASLTGNVSSYEYALGSSLGLRDIRDWTSVGSIRSFIASDLNLTNGQIVYVSVRAVSSNGLYSLTRSSSWTVDTSGPGISISSASTALTKNTNVTFTVTYTGATSISLSTSDITLNKTGTANGVVSVSGAGLASRTVTVSSISGNGTLGISIASGSALKSGNSAPAASSTSFTVDNLGPVITIGSPSLSITKNSNVLFIVSYDGASSVTLNSSHVTLNKTGTANGTIAVSGTGSTTRTVTISGITGDGTLCISIAANTAVDSLGNTSLSAGPSSVFTVDNTGPGISISSPSQSVTASASVSYTVTYTDATLITLSFSNVTLNKTGTANGTVSVTGSGSTSRTVTISGITGNGSLGISIASGTAADSVGNLASSAGPSSTLIVDNTGPSISLSAPSSSATRTSSVSYTLAYTDASWVTLSNSNITLNKTGTADGIVSISGSGTSTRIVTISNISGNGTLGISVSSGSATDSIGNYASSVGPSSTFTVDNTGPILTISSPSESIASGNSVSFTVSSNETVTFNLNTSDINLIKTGTANGQVEITGTGSLTRTININQLSGDGTIAISINSGIATDAVGNNNLETSISTSFRVIGCQSDSQTFAYTGLVQNFSVPSKCTKIFITIKGASGGNGCKSNYDVGSAGVGGYGYKFSGKINVTPGEQFDIYVAGKGWNCSNLTTYHGGGGGGGASAIKNKNSGLVLMLAGGGAGGSSPLTDGSNGYSGKQATNVVSSLAAINGFNANNTQLHDGEGGWGFTIGGTGGLEKFNSGVGFGGGGGGASNINGGSLGGSVSNPTGGAGNSFYNSTYVYDFLSLTAESGNGSVQISWSQ